MVGLESRLAHRVGARFYRFGWFSDRGPGTGTSLININSMGYGEQARGQLWRPAPSLGDADFAFALAADHAVGSVHQPVAPSLGSAVGRGASRHGRRNQHSRSQTMVAAHTTLD